jgi:hypothetical protein
METLTAAPLAHGSAVSCALCLSMALVACGGGDDSLAVAPPPTETLSGLPDPTGSLQSAEETARSLVLGLRSAMALAPLGIASRDMGTFAPGIDHGMAETYDCPGGGTASFQPDGAEGGAYVYSACVIESASYTGTGRVTLTLSNGELTQYTIDQAGIMVAMGGATHRLEAKVDCFAPGDALGRGRESPQHIVGPLLCVGHYGGFAYGSDLELRDGVINGSMQWPIGSARWNAYARDVGVDSGSVYIDAAGGSAGIRRVAPAAHQVVITVDGRSELFGVAQ